MSQLVRIIPVEAVPPSLGDNTGDLDRLRRKLLPLVDGRMPATPYNRLAPVAQAFRRAGFRGYAVINDLPERLLLVDFLPKEPACLPGMALDLGTTHLEALLLDMPTGKVLARANRENAQIAYGADILTRIHFAAKGDGLAELHRAVINCVNALAGELAAAAGVEVADIRALTVSGNTTMVHFFLKLDPHALCREPYIPVVNSPDPLAAEDLAISIHPAAVVWMLPSVGSYFGGDLISGILASGLDRQEKTSMLIDVGTNAEVVVGNRDWLIACAGAAGPALEGGVARMGMRAGPGAIEHVAVDAESGDISWRTIGNQPPVGICGSGIIDLVAGLYLAQIIDLRGKFRPERAGRLLIAGEQGPSLIVASGEESGSGESVLLSQVDLDALMRSKAAMYAILTTLMNQVGLQFEALHRIYVAGAFGRHIAPRQAIVLGMLPDLPLATYEPIGNSSLDGAAQLLADRDACMRAQEIVRKITYVELNVNQEFMIRFSGSRFIPHTENALFPSVPVFK